MKHISIFFILILLSTLNASDTRGLINYPNFFFVETGTGHGDGVQEAINTQVFNNIYSIEVEKNKAESVAKDYINYPYVKITLGDSALDLSTMLNNVFLPATFWLDSSYSSYSVAKYNQETGLTSEIEPLIQELNQIAAHSIKTHTIMINKINFILDIFSSVFTLQDIEDAIYAINPNYVIEYVDGGDTSVIEGNILLAYIP